MTTKAQRAPLARPLTLLPRGRLTLIAIGLLMALTVPGPVIGGRLASTQAVLSAPVTGPAANGLIAFERGGDGDIYVVEPDGSNKRPLIAGPAFEWGPIWSRDGTRHPIAWSPDGTQIAFHCCGDDDRIFVAAADGSSGAVEVGDPTLPAMRPDWSPDGRLIAFAGETPTEMGVYVMSPDGSDVRRLSQAADVGMLDWSPDGQLIAYHASQATGGPTHLRVVAPDGSFDNEVAGTPPGSILPFWSPDGDRIRLLERTEQTLRDSGGGKRAHAAELLHR